MGLRKKKNANFVCIFFWFKNYLPENMSSFLSKKVLFFKRLISQLCTKLKKKEKRKEIDVLKCIKCYFSGGDDNALIRMLSSSSTTTPTNFTHGNTALLTAKAFYLTCISRRKKT